MTDIVDRLKEKSGWTERSKYMGPNGDMLWDAIEEIERLRQVARSRKRKKDCAVAARNDHATGLDYWRERALAAEAAHSAGQRQNKGEA